MAGSSIMVVEDDQDIRDMLVFTLDRAGFTTIAASSAEQAIQRLGVQLPDLLVLDWMLPGQSGVDLARRLRRDGLTADIPVIMLTARGDESDKLRSFAAGVDDHVTKPFSPRELVARIHALLRRSGNAPDGVLQAGQLVLDTLGHRALVGDSEVHLGPTEFRLLEFLMRNPERAFDRAQLLDRVWGQGVYVEERTVDVHILRLRKALAPHGLDSLVQTVRGVGYRLSAAA